MRSIDYIDTRGPWPIYVNGLYATELRGVTLDIDVEGARRLLGDSRPKVKVRTPAEIGY